MHQLTDENMKEMLLSLKDNLFKEFLNADGTETLDLESILF